MQSQIYTLKMFKAQVCMFSFKPVSVQVKKTKKHTIVSKTFSKTEHKAHPVNCSKIPKTFKMLTHRMMFNCPKPVITDAKEKEDSFLCFLQNTALSGQCTIYV
ncbi:hypothetical protein CHARACLAT_024936 [Characodon lateralis]|uniref:Uncharacterized protein n=1 Tax=Characodon lateralis TaxID=208331 RepID=A0ABU7DVK2_9TELE|nr:hypothetical protein [Characodon lateralis]